ncbi:DUF429 domain-containing protein [Nakamurella alba]|uniref:DUF429 domain-containing protein n=1 Tax=Nakamurella alba TaxID=2665158 RepID=UPI0018AAFB83|nr:DUF429 domain-containing protein [Nakamurella alba]
MQPGRISRPVVGVDISRGSWVAVRLDADGRFDGAALAPTIAGIVADLGRDAALIGIDVPIGLSDTGVRAADLAARAALPGRAASVFLTPVRAALLEPDHAAATRISREVTGAGISRQAHGLRHKILDVDDFAPRSPVPLVEIHPELSFRRLGTAVIPVVVPGSKRSWSGIRQRIRLLAAAGIDIGEDIGDAGRECGPDDVLDAAAVAWSARRVLAGTADRFPADGADPGTSGQAVIFA